MFHISFVCLGLVVLPSIFLIFTDTFEVVLVVITPVHHKNREGIAPLASWLMLGGSWVTFNPAGKLNAGRSSLPEVFSTVDAGETLAVPADVHVFLYLGFFQGFTTAVAGEEHHLNSTSARLRRNAKPIRFC